ncbi:MAG: gluconate 2-dehydrogenase subunit 3 family protein [Pseudomonadales bacterium]|nr:gluconate 2-dehydrogenase subunit 3 family protein [Pseudomonadales bacterium]
MTDSTIQSDSPFDVPSRETVAAIANLMIPASEEFKVPAAGDPQILAAILDQLAAERELVVDGLSALEGAARAKHEKGFIEVDNAEKPALIEGLLASHGMFLQTLITAILASYYQDSRVMASLDMEIRPPFPGGFEVEQGDWSLLDPVRQREPFYRKV